MHDPRYLLPALFVIWALGMALRRFEREGRPPGVFWRVWQHTGQALWGRNALWLLLSVGATVLLIVSGWERQLQDFFQRGNLVSRDALWALLAGGAFWMVVVAIVLLVWGWSSKIRDVRLAGATAMQSVIVAFVITHVFKAITGRLGPLDPNHPDRAPFPKTESTTDFAFDVWNRLIDDGRFFWPSGHTMSSMVLVTALWTCFPERKWIAWVGYPLVAVMGLGMIDGDFHWTSDVIAGLFLGWAAGSVVGRGMRAERDRRESGA